jgi:hypothetical protein
VRHDVVRVISNAGDHNPARGADDENFALFENLEAVNAMFHPDPEWIECWGRDLPVPTSFYCKVTSTWITPSILAAGSGSSAFPITAPTIRARSVPFIARPAVDELTSRSPVAIAPFSAVTFVGTTPITASGTACAVVVPYVRGDATMPGFVE